MAMVKIKIVKSKVEVIVNTLNTLKKRFSFYITDNIFPKKLKDIQNKN